MRNMLYAGVAIAALAIPGAAFAQSTGSIEFDDSDIVVQGQAERGIAGIEIPDTPKAKVVVTSELLRRQTPGQSVNEVLNQVPGVSFTNNDPFGSLGGSFSIRGFNSDRISQTLDGIPLNDSGNYALYTNQNIDIELVDNINVNLGSTDVDSPTPAAVGGTININTIEPSDTLSAMAVASYGDIIADGKGKSRPYNRVFGLIQTGDITGHGTKAWFSASRVKQDSTFSNYGGVDKQQYNAKIYQRIGSNGDFVSLAGHWNQNRNNFNGSPFSYKNYPISREERFYDINYPCTINTSASATVVDTPNSCGSEFERRFNPSNTGNIRLNSKFNFTDKLVFSFDGAYTYTKANGGGTSVGYESEYQTADGEQLVGYIGGKPYFGIDMNGDGTLGVDANADGVISPSESDQIRVLTPSQTVTNRWIAIANLAYEINDTNRVRLSYSFDRARHRQTGEAGLLRPDGSPYDVFPINDGLKDVNGNLLEKRDRKSFATLHQVSGEYSGTFLEDRLNVLAGLRVPFFSRDLNNYCFTTNTSGYVDCIPSAAGQAAYAAANPYVVNADGSVTGAALPQSRHYNYSKVLPSIGFTYHFTPALSIAAGYTKNISVPGTDPLYNSLYLPDTDANKPKPETSDSFDGSVRFKSGTISTSLTGWYSSYNNRLVSAYKVECDCSVETNLGKVEKYGVDGSFSWQPIPQISFYAFGSYIVSDIKQDVLAGSDGSVIATAGNYERGVPKYMFGGRVQGQLGPVEIGVQAKRTGPRYFDDTNTFRFDPYTVVDAEIRYSLKDAGLENSRLQLNVTNLFDENYIGSFSGGLTLSSASSFVNIGPPRAIVGSLVVGF
ncbi:MAG: TonB-dependent receptor [Sphingomonas sp.]|nr:TonB-dependent receptor [Sphingomonas sp.]